MRALVLEMWLLLLAMAPYLLLGFTMAGILKVLIPEDFLIKHLSGKKVASVFKAALIGIPLPVCSCGVIPVAAHLKKAGAGRGAILSFLTSTPTTGVDSILATVSLLGWPFALLRMGTSFFIGIFSGISANLFTFKEEPVQKVVHVHDGTKPCCMPAQKKFTTAFKYAYIELIDDIGRWLIIGVVLGGVISYFVPASAVGKYLGNPFISYSFMLLLASPMYVCATGSIPIVASLIMKGMSPGAGLVFLIAGPATNTATLSFVGGKLGSKTLFIYLVSIIVGSVLFGGIVDMGFSHLGTQIMSMGQMQMLPYWLQVASAWVLLALIVRSSLTRLIKSSFSK
jgi:uncharacterized membrane protein YraQ (UPF0718 family)